MKLVKTQCISPTKIELVAHENIANIIETNGYDVEDGILVVHLPQQTMERLPNEVESRTSVPGQNSEFI